MALISLAGALSLVAASQQVLIIGGSPASDCFAAARASAATQADLTACEQAVSDTRLSRVDQAATWVNYGIVLRQRGALDAALNAYDRALILKPDLAEAYLNRGAARVSLGQFEMAMMDLNQALELGPLEPEAALVNRALVYEARGELEQAWRDLQTALELAPGYGPALREIARYQVHGQAGR